VPARARRATEAAPWWARSMYYTYKRWWVWEPGETGWASPGRRCEHGQREGGLLSKPDDVSRCDLARVRESRVSCVWISVVGFVIATHICEKNQGQYHIRSRLVFMAFEPAGEGRARTIVADGNLNTVCAWLCPPTQFVPATSKFGFEMRMEDKDRPARLWTSHPLRSSRSYLTLFWSPTVNFWDAFSHGSEHLPSSKCGRPM
jgi:hypothetical protein